MEICRTGRQTTHGRSSEHDHRHGQERALSDLRRSYAPQGPIISADMPALPMEGHAMNEVEYSRRCIERAEAENLYARALPDGRVAVWSHGVRRVLEFHPVGRYVRFRCPCDAGQNRHELVPCKHAARAGLLLERRGIIRRSDGALWRIPETLPLEVAQ